MKKLKYLPLNMLLCISSFVVPFILLVNVIDNALITTAISLYIYLLDVLHSSNKDYLEDMIDEIKKEDEINKIKRELKRLSFNINNLK